MVEGLALPDAKEMKKARKAFKKQMKAVAKANKAAEGNSYYTISP